MNWSEVLLNVFIFICVFSLFSSCLFLLFGVVVDLFSPCLFDHFFCDDFYCHDCGVHLREPDVCSGCGEKLRGHDFCSYCGQPAG